MDLVEQVLRGDEKEVIRIIESAPDREALRRWANEPDLRGRPCLLLATSARIAKYILDADANPNGCDTFGATALHMACERGNLELTELLLACKADLEITNDCGETPFLYAVANNRVSLVPYLLARTDTIPRQAGRLARQRGYDNITSLLLEANAEIDPQTPETELEEYEGARGLVEAARCGRTARVNILLDCNLPTDAYCGSAALIEASGNGHLETVQVLLDAKAHVDQPDMLGETSLFKAVLGNHVEVAKILMEWRADVNAENMAMQTPITVAQNWGFKWPGSVFERYDAIKKGS